jgi:hypothetical protein
MLLRKLSSLLLIFLILNLNMVVPAVSYATADETCSCHLNSADRQCHCDDGCKSCGMDKKQGARVSTLDGIKGQGSENLQPSVIKGQTCSMSPQSDGSILPVSAIPFMVPVFCNAAQMVQVSNLSLQSENPLHGISITPFEKPPMS